MATSLFGVGETLNAANSGTIVPQSFVGGAGQTLFSISSFTYTVGTSSLQVYVNGTLQISGRDYLETSTSSFTLLQGTQVGDLVDVFGVVAFTPTAVTLGVILVGGTYTLQNYINDGVVNVKNYPFLVKADGVTDDTAAWARVLSYCCPLNLPMLHPGGVSIVTPGTQVVGAGTWNTALMLQSGCHIQGLQGATIKVVNGYSTDASPKELSIFCYTSHIQNISFDGITFDLNGQNNSTSPARPVTYNQFNHAAIIGNGDNGYADDVSITNCKFINCAGVCALCPSLVLNNHATVLGQRWTINSNLFYNNGLDTNDFTAIYAWAECVTAMHNIFWNPTAPHAVGQTGGATCYEVHGSHQRVTHNYCYNYKLGFYISPNFTNVTTGVIVENNDIYCSDFGVLLWRSVGAVNYQLIDGVSVSRNNIYFDNYTYSGGPTYKAGIAYQGQIATPQGAILDVTIAGNRVSNIGTLLCQAVRIDTSTTANQQCADWSITDNIWKGTCDGVFVIGNVTNGFGFLEISRNKAIELTPDALANPPHGIYINATGTFKTVVINDNAFVDERGSPLMQIGIYLAAGTITDLSLGGQVFKGMTAANFFNAGATITNMIGWAAEESFTNAVADGGTIVCNANYTGLQPKSVIVTPSVAGTMVAVTATAVNNFTVAIKTVSAGAIVAGTAQRLYWRAKF